MVITGKTIKSKGWISGALSGNFRDASYDLTIGELVTPDGQIAGEFVIPPQGIVKVISAEIVQVPKDMLGYVHVKTGLCNEGILPLNIGLVDPGYDGPLQSTLINFGKARIPLRRGDVFSRLVFHTLDSPVTPAVKPVYRSDLEFSVKKQVHMYIADTFLDVAENAKKAADQAFGTYKDWLLFWIPVAGALIAGLTFALNYANLWTTHRTYRPEDAARTEVLKGQMDESINSLKEQNKKLQSEVDSLKERLEKSSKSNFNAKP